MNSTKDNAELKKGCKSLSEYIRNRIDSMIAKCEKNREMFNSMFADGSVYDIMLPEEIQEIKLAMGEIPEIIGTLQRMKKHSYYMDLDLLMDVNYDLEVIDNLINKTDQYVEIYQYASKYIFRISNLANITCCLFSIPFCFFKLLWKKKEK